MSDRLGLIARSMWTGTRLRCPRCGKGRMMAGWIRLAPLCFVCGLQFESAPGDWSGAVMIAQMLMGLATIPVFIALTFATELGFTARLTWTVVVVLALWALTYRNIKGMWFGWLYAAKFIGSEDDPTLT